MGRIERIPILGRIGQDSANSGPILPAIRSPSDVRGRDWAGLDVLADIPIFSNFAPLVGVF